MRNEEENNSGLPPVTPEGLRGFLTGSYIKGIGEVYAKKIIDKFGNEILDKDFNLERLREIPGLGEQKISDIIQSFESLKVSPSVISFLYSAGLKDYEAEKIISHYGKRLEKILLWDPYEMVENVWKLSFYTADKIGRYLKILPDDPRRIRGAVLTAIKFYAEEGNMFATEEQVKRTTAKITGLTEDIIFPHISSLIEDDRVIKSLDGYYLPVYFKAEKEAADKLLKMQEDAGGSYDDFVMPQKDLNGNLLSEAQKEAIMTVMKNKVSIITGGPGTGKTTTIKGIISLFADIDKKIVLAAPTGRAAKRITELTGEEAKTIHRLLGYSVGRGYRNKKLNADILILDEASMLEQVLFNHLLQAIEENTKVVLVGDTDQLPAIGAGNVLKDMMESGVIPVVNLYENFRQHEGSGIASKAKNIKEGEFFEGNPENDFVFIGSETTRKTHDRLLSLIAKEIPAYTGVKPNEILLVTPQQEGPLGAKQLNIELQELINPDAPELKRGMKKFRLGDPVMQTSNSSDKKVYNGETGIITFLDAEKGLMEVTFKDGKIITYGLKDLKELTLSYATTVHKLQGSETDNMVMVVTMAHKPMLYRNLIYTGVSRAKKLCVLVGEPNAVNLAISSKDKIKRNSNLKNRLRQKE